MLGQDCSTDYHGTKDASLEATLGFGVLIQERITAAIPAELGPPSADPFLESPDKAPAKKDRLAQWSQHSSSKRTCQHMFQPMEELDKEVINAEVFSKPDAIESSRYCWTRSLLGRLS